MPLAEKRITASAFSPQVYKVQIHEEQYPLLSYILQCETKTSPARKDKTDCPFPDRYDSIKPEACAVQLAQHNPETVPAPAR